MLTITWHAGEPPADLPVTQVYGLIFDREGRLLIKGEERKGRMMYAPAGGTPEPFDRDREATLRRELLEEINTTVGREVYLLGYQLIEGDGDRPPYAQLRMTAMIDKIGTKRPDPDNGKTYERLLVTPARAVTLLGWGKVAEEQIAEAVRVARLRFGVEGGDPTDLSV